VLERTTRRYRVKVARGSVPKRGPEDVFHLRTGDLQPNGSRFGCNNQRELRARAATALELNEPRQLGDDGFSRVKAQRKTVGKFP